MLFKRKEKNGCWKELAAVADRVCKKSGKSELTKITQIHYIICEHTHSVKPLHSNTSDTYTYNVIFPSLHFHLPTSLLLAEVLPSHTSAIWLAFISCSYLLFWQTEWLVYSFFINQLWISSPPIGPKRPPHNLNVLTDLIEVATLQKKKEFFQEHNFLEEGAAY